MKTFGSDARWKFKKGFIIEPNHLQTIESLIRNRFPNSDIFFEVTFNNSNKYKTNSLDEVISEDNSAGNNINKICIVVEHEDVLHLNIIFEKKEKTAFSVTGSNKDSIFLLFNDVKTYIDKEIAIVRIFRLSERSIMLYIQIVLMLAMVAAFMIPAISLSRGNRRCFSIRTKGIRE